MIGRFRLMPVLMTVAGVFLVVPHLVPSLWFGEPDLPARTARIPKKSMPQAVAQAPRSPASADLSLRLGDNEPLYTGSVPVQPGARPGAEKSARVVVKAEQSVAMSAELNARIIRMPFKEGDRFQAGAVLVEFDCQRIRAELAAALATQKLTRNAHETVSQLHKLGSAGTYNVRQAQFEMEKSNAEVDNLRAKQATCTIRAPFSGSVAERLAATHEVVNPNQPVLRIVDTAAPELQLILPSAWLGWLASGAAFEVEIDETRRRYGATIHNISGAVDPVSQTVRVLARLDGQPDDVVPGMSGIARFKTPGRQP